MGRRARRRAAPLRRTALSTWPPPRQVEDGAGRERALGGGEPGDQGGDLLDGAEAAHGDLGAHVVDELLAHLLEDVGLDGGRGDAVDEDAAAGGLLAQGLGQGDDPGLGGAVGRGLGVAFLAGDGGDVDDAPPAAVHHARCHGAAAQEDADQVDGDDAFPGLDRVLPGLVGGARDAGVADQDVNVTEGGLRGGDRGVDGAGVGDVDDHGVRRRAGERGARRLEGVRVHVPQADQGAARRQAAGDGQPDAARGSRHHRRAPFEVVPGHGSHPPLVALPRRPFGPPPAGFLRRRRGPSPPRGRAGAGRHAVGTADEHRLDPARLPAATLSPNRPGCHRGASGPSPSIPSHLPPCLPFMGMRAGRRSSKRERPWGA